jgi:hypothetical protein
MEITIQINNCGECKHGDHTGGYTKGGAKPCCNHDITVKEKGFDCFKRIIPYKTELGYRDREIHIAKRIPIWCPLKRGCKY